MRKRSLGSLILSIAVGCCISGWLSTCLAQADDDVLTEVHGKVSVKRARRSNFVGVYVGMSVGTGDMFRLDKPDSRANITCSDGSPRLVDHSPFTLQCPSVTANNIGPV